MRQQVSIRMVVWAGLISAARWRWRRRRRVWFEGEVEGEGEGLGEVNGVADPLWACCASAWASSSFSRSIIKVDFVGGVGVGSRAVCWIQAIY